LKNVETTFTLLKQIQSKRKKTNKQTKEVIVTRHPFS